MDVTFGREAYGTPVSLPTLSIDALVESLVRVLRADLDSLSKFDLLLALGRYMRANDKAD